MNFIIKTYGCQMNERDSEALCALLESCGHRRAESESAADCIIVNTCSVRAKAEEKALGKLGLLVKGKQRRPERLVGVAGCMVQRMRENVFEKVPGLDFAVGTGGLHRMVDVLQRCLEGETGLLECPDPGAERVALDGHNEGVVTAFVNVLLGCNRRCTYCIVPRVRGREWSRPSLSVLAEVRALAERGVREITLLGQSVMSYGRQNADCVGEGISPRGFREAFPRLLEAVAAVPGIRRVRFTSGHPSGCSRELARAMAEIENVCEHLHLPLQSGSDRILGRMRRGYGTQAYRRAVERIRSAVPGVGLSTDVIVGFPSESIEEFEMTRALMQEIGFDNAFVFKYSARPGTPAADWADDVPAEEKLRRNKLLLADQDRRSRNRNQRFVGRCVEVLAEGVSVRNAARWQGRTRDNRIVVFEPVESIAPGRLAWVHVERAGPQTVYGRVERVERMGKVDEP